MLKNLFRYIGSKNRLFKKYNNINILPQNINSSNILESYSEPFCGSCAIFYNLVNKGVIGEKTIVYLNDLNEDIIRLLVYLRDNKWVEIEEQIASYRVLKTTEEYNSLKERYINGREPLSWLQLMGNSFLGFYGTAKRFNRDSTFLKKSFNINNLYNWSEVLKTHNINLSCKDYHEVPVCEFNFVDPPYVSSNGDLYMDCNQNLMSEIVKKYAGSHTLITNNWSEEWFKYGYPIHNFDCTLNFKGHKLHRKEVAIEIKPFPSERKALALTI